MTTPMGATSLTRPPIDDRFLGGCLASSDPRTVEEARRLRKSSRNFIASGWETTRAARIALTVIAPAPEGGVAGGYPAEGINDAPDTAAIRPTEEHDAGLGG